MVDGEDWVVSRRERECRCGGVEGLLLSGSGSEGKSGSSQRDPAQN